MGTLFTKRGLAITVPLWLACALVALYFPVTSGNWSVVLASIAIILSATAVAAFLLLLVCSAEDEAEAYGSYQS